VFRSHAKGSAPVLFCVFFEYQHLIIYLPDGMLVDSACDVEHGGISVSDYTPGVVDSHGKCGDYQCNKTDVILVAVLRVLVYSGYLCAVIRWCRVWPWGIASTRTRTRALLQCWVFG